jgi:colicin import membrane protein
MPPSRARSSWSTTKWVAAILAIAVHVAFVLFLIFNVNWQNPKPEPVTAELYVPPAPAKIEPAKPPPEPPKTEPPKPEPPRPQAEAKPPPVEPLRPDIALKQKQERAKKEQAERDRKEKEKQDAEKREAERREADKKQQEKRLAEARERQAREADALKAQALRERQAQEKTAADAARAKADADYIRRIQAKIRGNVVVPPDMPGNPEAIFAVVQLPSGEIIDVQLGKSSGVRAYDEAVQRAILKSSPLPRPDSPDIFRRNLTLKFRPLD